MKPKTKQHALAAHMDAAHLVMVSANHRRQEPVPEDIVRVTSVSGPHRRTDHQENPMHRREAFTIEIRCKKKDALIVAKRASKVREEHRPASRDETNLTALIILIQHKEPP